MIQSICILGRQPALGLAELESLYGGAHVQPVGQFAAELDIKVDFSRLGGSTRLAAVVAEIPSTNWKLVEKELQKIVRSAAFAVPAEGKFHFGLSAYGFAISPAKLSALGLTLKKLIRSRGVSVRVVPNNEPALNTAQVYHNHLADEHGAELLIIADKDRSVIARTIAVQDIDNYTLRDRGRPKRDPKVGMLPPKLAQIIINLAAAESRVTSHESRVIVDPFCGTGVLLQEALLMGFGAYGSDLEPRMIEYSRSNLDWFTSKFQIPNSKFDLSVGDATTFRLPEDLNIVCVACETYLGRPFTAPPDRQMLEQTVSEVNTILTKFLRNIHCQLPSGTRLCVAVPAWLSPTPGPNMSRLDEVQDDGEARTEPYKKYREGALQLTTQQFAKRSHGADGYASRQVAAARYVRHLPLIDQISDLGYNQVRFECVRGNELLYYREDQIVARELLVLTVK